jgi:hypothetical protein
VTPGAVRCSAWVRRLVAFKWRVLSPLLDWLLARLPYRALEVESPKKVRVLLLVDTGEHESLLQAEWEIDAKESPKLADAKCMVVAIEVWEDEDTAPSRAAMSHLIPGNRRKPSRCIPVCPVAVNPELLCRI